MMQIPFTKWQVEESELNREEEKLSSLGISLIGKNDPEYPSQLKEIFNAPILLYARGNISLLHDPRLISVVGTRRITPYGRSSLKKILNPIINDVITVSGLAYGVDDAVHRFSVERNRPTIAVVPGGIDNNSIYPKMQVSLVNKILETGGLIISENPPGTPIHQFHFPIRNRIISGLSRATCIIEADLKSGTMITARLALEQNRDVFALPGPIDRTTSLGPNQLISQGATPIINGQTLAEYYEIRQSKQDSQLPPKHAIIISALSKSPLDKDTLSINTGLTIPEISEILIELELKNLISENQGYYTTIK